jgi:hypothetical protein
VEGIVNVPCGVEVAVKTLPSIIAGVFDGGLQVVQGKLAFGIRIGYCKSQNKKNIKKKPI